MFYEKSFEIKTETNVCQRLSPRLKYSPTLRHSVLISTYPYITANVTISSPYNRMGGSV